MGRRQVHVWSVGKGESSIQELIDNREHLNKFRWIIWALTRTRPARSHQVRQPVIPRQVRDDQVPQRL